MLNGEPLREDASIRSFNGGIGCQVASSLEEALLLPMTWLSCGTLGKMRFSLTSKDTWAWYDVVPLFLSFLFYFIYYVTNPFLLGYSNYFQG